MNILWIVKKKISKRPYFGGIGFSMLTALLKIVIPTGAGAHATAEWRNLLLAISEETYAALASQLFIVLASTKPACWN